MKPIDPAVACVAVSLYAYNVAPSFRAMNLYNHFGGECADLSDLLQWVKSPYWATEMPQPTCDAYIQYVLERYEIEATERVRVNRQGFRGKINA